MPPKYRSTERRKERCRNAARSRRTKEAEVFTKIEQSLPLSRQQLQQLDKISVMRVFTNTLKLRILFKQLRDLESHEHDGEFAEALDSFVLLLDQDGTVVFVSYNITKLLGIPAVDMLGSSIYLYAHPCDHSEIQEALGACAHPDSHHGNKEFFMRLKCALSATGRNVNVNTTSLYKVIKCSSRTQIQSNSKLNLNVSTENPALKCMIIIGSVIPQDSEICVDNRTFVSQHSTTMKFTSVDDKVKTLLGYKPSELYNKSVFEFHHAADSASLEKSFTHLFSKGQTETMLYRFLAKGGGYVWMKTQATTVCDKHSNRPQSVVCVNYVISGVEEPGLVMAAQQVISSDKDPTTDPRADECLVETLRLFDDNVPIPSGPLDVVHFPVRGPQNRRTSNASASSTVSSAPTTSADESDYNVNVCSSDGFDVDDGLATVYEDLCLSDCMLSDIDMSVGEGVDSDHDTIRRMTDTVFCYPEDEKLPDLKTDLLELVAQEKPGAKRRNLSIDSILTSTRCKRACTDSDSLLSSTATQNSILMNLLTTGDTYQLRQKRHSYPQSSKDQQGMMAANKQINSKQMKPPAAAAVGAIQNSAVPVAAPCPGRFPGASSKDCTTLKSTGGTVVHNPNVGIFNLDIVAQRTENMRKQRQHRNSSTVTTDMYGTVSSTSQQGVARQSGLATSSLVAKHQAPQRLANVHAGLASNPMATQVACSPRDSSVAMVTTQNQQQQQQQPPIDHQYFTRKKRRNSSAERQTEETVSSPIDIVPSAVAETVIISDEDLPLLSPRTSHNLPELGLNASLSVNSPSHTSSNPAIPIGRNTLGRIQVIGDTSALTRGSVQIQRYTPEVANSLTSALGSQEQRINSLTPESRPDYYLISAQRLEELLAAANAQKNGVRK